MIIPKSIFAISEAISKDPMRFNLTGVHVSRPNGKAQAAATDGHHLIVAKWDEPKAEDMPATIKVDLEQAEKLDLIIPGDDWKKAGKAIPKGKNDIPIIKNAVISEKVETNDHHARTVPIVSTDLSSVNRIDSQLVVGEFPDIETVIPKHTSENSVSICVNARYLAGIAKALADIAPDGKATSVLLTVPNDPMTPITLEAKSPEGVEALAVLMPMRSK